ncbi:hypothetical protein [Microbacterium caowuchunii]|uniref:Uncharacterized protein n=1 Tax=Microbacterium caowuchunii TaxID=2614638 RepID=A0A5N0TC79_9MICO|nr:hypothetical protein [Microbacterium caowuchunii]KAA9132351.1 hypothetical protein F6B40_11720 [Microbacterium caowuchunii]
MMVAPGGRRVPERSTSVPLRRLRRAARAWWAAVTSGRFFTWWSAAVSLLASVTVLGSYFGVTQAQDYHVAVGVSAIGWAVIAALVLPVAWTERRVHGGCACAGGVSRT